MVDFDSHILGKAIDEAWKEQFLTYPNPPVAAVVVKNNQIISLQTHKKAGEPHAEVLAFKEAYKKLTDDKGIDSSKSSAELHNYLSTNAKELFKECTLYITLEPCHHHGKTPPCSDLIGRLKPKKVVFATYDPNKDAGGGAKYLKSVGVDISHCALKDAEAKELIKPFVIWQKRAYILFKIAIREDGSYDGGVISSRSSRELVHKIRSSISLLAIGGDSVRIDRPLLDSRLVGQKPPDVQILTSKEVDRDIPLFSVKGRSVTIKKELDLQTPSLVMVEGGGRLLEALAPKIDMLGVFVAPKTGGSRYLPSDLNLSPIHSYTIGEDRLDYFSLPHTHI
ncbi:MAG: bifunctional diaminohydroxyphosphoribosylaminopyrimidine deaminase/5-amino-6-(5-phosphoribosylamino)uracil reductase RibD [Campylobacterales bacterium]